jgi:hypothetical protein
MKVRITESQAKRLNLINEDTDMVSQFEQYCKVKVQELNNIYTKISNLSIIDIFENSVNFGELYNYVSNIENKLLEAEKRTYDYINNLPDNDLDTRIDNAYSSVGDKLTSIQLIIMELEKLQNLNTEHKLKDSFNDVKPIDISSTEI